MKINSIKYAEANNNRIVNNNSAKANNTNFKGTADMLVKMWEGIENGGRAVSFTVEDMLGTNIPRTYKGAMSGYKYTKKVNIPALIQEALREFLTGPTMCVVPIAVLTLSKKGMGESANTHVENIRNLSTIAQDVEGNLTKDSFFRGVASDLLQQSVGESGYRPDDADVDALVSNMKNIAQMPKKGKENKRLLAEAMDGIQESFSGIIKRCKKEYAGDDFLTATYTIAKKNGASVEKGKAGLKDYIGYVTSYANDLFKQADANGVVDKSKVKDFKNSWCGKRIAVVASMIGFTGALMMLIPKIYTLASGTVNPNASAFYDKANEANSQQKGVK